MTNETIERPTFLICGCGECIPDEHIEYVLRTNELGEEYTEFKVYCLKCGKYHEGSEWIHFKDMEDAKQHINDYIEELTEKTKFELICEVMGWNLIYPYPNEVDYLYRKEDYGRSFEFDYNCLNEVWGKLKKTMPIYHFPSDFDRISEWSINANFFTESVCYKSKKTAFAELVKFINWLKDKEYIK
jgi:hypothetical protein